MRRRSKTTSSRTDKNGRRVAKEANKVVASTAGRDNWKTWAGRTHGGEDFQVLDLFRGFQRTLQPYLISPIPPPGTACPVCFCEPNGKAEWHITSSCSHAVCLDCFRAYATSQVNDKEQNGPLKCPVCPQVLRTRDAIVAFAHDPDLIRQWDLKIRNQLLRALPAYRSCPHCSDSDGSAGRAGTGSRNSTSNSSASSNSNDAASNPIGNNGGGGFVTPECLSPQNQERRNNAVRILNRLGTLYLFCFGIYLMIITIISNSPSSSALADLCCMLLMSYPLIRVTRIIRIELAQNASREMARPISVECPCCDKSFLLPSETAEVVMNDDDTKKWLDARTRPCPSCSAPIEKSGGCNHMRCGQCQASFCWACMRLRTSCAAYACNNGAPFRNAEMNGAQELQPQDPITSTIDAIMSTQSNPPLRLGNSDAGIVVMAFVGRHILPLHRIFEPIMRLVTLLFEGGVLNWVVGGYILKEAYEAALEYYRNRGRGAGRRARRHQNGNRRMTASERILFELNERRQEELFGQQRLTERQMIEEAVRRSLQEQHSVAS